MLALTLSSAILAQEPLVHPEQLQQGRRLQGDQLAFCVIQDSILTDFHSAMAQALADTLLLESKIFNLALPHHVQPLGYRIPLDYEQIFVLLTNECDAFMGFTLASGLYPDWLTVTAPYLSTTFTIVSTDPSIIDLTSLPRSEKVGTVLGSLADTHYRSWLRTLPEGQRWRRIPYPDNKLLLERLVDGTIAAALVWEPALYEFTKAGGQADGIRAIRTGAFTPPTLSFTIALRNTDSFIQTMLDEAIRAMTTDSSLQELIAVHGLPGKPPVLDRR